MIIDLQFARLDWCEDALLIVVCKSDQTDQSCSKEMYVYTLHEPFSLQHVQCWGLQFPPLFVITPTECLDITSITKSSCCHRASQSMEAVVMLYPDTCIYKTNRSLSLSAGFVLFYIRNIRVTYIYHFNFIDLFWFLSSVCNQSNMLDMHHCIYCKKSVSAYLPFSRTLVHVCQLTYSYIDGGEKFGIFRPICLYLGIVFSMPIFSNSSISLTPKCRGSIANSALLISSPAAVRLTSWFFPVPP